MSPKFRDYLIKQLKKSLTMVLLSVTIIFIILSVAFSEFYVRYSIRKDNDEVYSIIKNDLSNIYKTIDYYYLNRDTEDINYNILKSELYKTRSKSTIKFNFTIVDSDFSIVASNLHTPNMNLLRENKQFSESLNKFMSLNSMMELEKSPIRYNDPQKSVMSILYKSSDDIFIIEPLLESFIDLEHKLSSNILLADKYNNILFDNTIKYQDSLGKLAVDKEVNAIYSNNNTLYSIITVKSKFITSNILLYSSSITLVSLLVLLWLINPISKRIAIRLDEPLDELLEGIEMNKDGNLDYFITSHHFHEFDKIYDEFNDLMQSTKSLMIKNEELIETKNAIEIKHLKNQFNPHFIYNTIESIRYEVMFDPKTASNMLLSLGRLMQYSVENLNEFVSIKEDFIYLKDYLKLQKMRFKDRLKYNINYDENIKDLKIPKLLIQPVIENSIKHNMENVESLEINVTAKASEDYLEFKIQDNGIGLSEKDLDSLQLTLNDSNYKTNSLGLYNINRSIKLIYGEKYGVEITSDKGLIVSVKIPRS